MEARATAPGSRPAPQAPASGAAAPAGRLDERPRRRAEPPEQLPVLRDQVREVTGQQDTVLRQQNYPDSTKGAGGRPEGDDHDRHGAPVGSTGPT